MWEVFEHLCELKGVSTYTVAKATGIPQSTLSNWKMRRNLIGAERGQKIADYFGVSLEYLMTGREPEEYYENSETAKVAQEILDNRDLRLLFSAAKDSKPETLRQLYEMLLILKKGERE